MANIENDKRGVITVSGAGKLDGRYSTFRPMDPDQFFGALDVGETQTWSITMQRDTASEHEPALEELLRLYKEACFYWSDHQCGYEGMEQYEARRAAIAEHVVARIRAERDKFKAAFEHCINVRTATEAERDQAIAERDAPAWDWAKAADAERSSAWRQTVKDLTARADKAEAERDAAIARADDLKHQSDRRGAALINFGNELDAAITARDAAIAERDAWKDRAKDRREERDASRQHAKTLWGERDQAIAERDAWVARLTDCELLLAKAEAERDQAIAERETAFDQRDKWIERAAKTERDRDQAIARAERAETRTVPNARIRMLFARAWANNWTADERYELERICLAAAAPAEAVPESHAGRVADTPRWRHKKRGTVYREIGEALLQTATLIGEREVLKIYAAEPDGMLWARPINEFTDGRFELLAAAPTPPAV